MAIIHIFDVYFELNDESDAKASVTASNPQKITSQMCVSMGILCTLMSFMFCFAMHTFALFSQMLLQSKTELKGG